VPDKYKGAPLEQGPCGQSDVRAECAFVLLQH
jgi:hypothetical protein